jgi:hypothetical protein
MSYRPSRLPPTHQCPTPSRSTEKATRNTKQARHGVSRQAVTWPGPGHDSPCVRPAERPPPVSTQRAGGCPAERPPLAPTEPAGECLAGPSCARSGPACAPPNEARPASRRADGRRASHGRGRAASPGRRPGACDRTACHQDRPANPARTTPARDPGCPAADGPGWDSGCAAAAHSPASDPRNGCGCGSCCCSCCCGCRCCKTGSCFCCGCCWIAPPRCGSCCACGAAPGCGCGSAYRQRPHPHRQPLPRACLPYSLLQLQCELHLLPAAAGVGQELALPAAAGRWADAAAAPPAARLPWHLRQAGTRGAAQGWGALCPALWREWRLRAALPVRQARAQAPCWLAAALAEARQWVPAALALLWRGAAPVSSRLQRAGLAATCSRAEDPQQQPPVMVLAQQPALAPDQPAGFQLMSLPAVQQQAVPAQLGIVQAQRQLQQGRQPAGPPPLPALLSLPPAQRRRPGRSRAVLGCYRRSCKHGESSNARKDQCDCATLLALGQHPPWRRPAPRCGVAFVQGRAPDRGQALLPC